MDLDDLELFFIVALALDAVACVVGLFAGASGYYFAGLGVMAVYLGMMYLCYITYGRL